MDLDSFDTNQIYQELVPNLLDTNRILYKRTLIYTIAMRCRVCGGSDKLWSGRTQAHKAFPFRVFKPLAPLLVVTYTKVIANINILGV
jgi:hypothetical protein